MTGAHLGGRGACRRRSCSATAAPREGGRRCGHGDGRHHPRAAAQLFWQLLPTHMRRKKCGYISAHGPDRTFLKRPYLWFRRCRRQQHSRCRLPCAPAPEINPVVLNYLSLNFKKGGRRVLFFCGRSPSGALMSPGLAVPLRVSGCAQTLRTLPEVYSALDTPGSRKFCLASGGYKLRKIQM